jgi:Lycopene cyclase protein
MKHYHYIFTGSGLAALMTVYKMVQSEKFKDKNILLIDQDTKSINDRTWCFWEKPNHNWEHIVTMKWDFALFANDKFQRVLDMKPYQYNMIRGLDFYKLVFGLMAKQSNIAFVNEKVLDFKENGSQVNVTTDKDQYTCDKLFNSVYNPIGAESQLSYPILQQHFIGWFIKSEQAVFNPEQATFMDFSLTQNGNTKFMYVLPISTTEALIEPTLFSHKHLKTEEYEAEIKNYVTKLGIKNYEIVDKEWGSIPMTVYPFWKQNSKNIIHIGSMGGWSKASTGFTFMHTEKKATKLIQFLETKTDFRQFHKKTKFWYYDLLFLDVLDKHNELGSTIFSSLFKTGKSSLIFKFLDEETNYWEDFQVILKCPKGPFIRALFGRIF